MTTTLDQEINQELYDARILHLFPGRKRQYIRQLKDQVKELRQTQSQNWEHYYNIIRNYSTAPRWMLELFQEDAQKYDQQLAKRIRHHNWQIAELSGARPRADKINDGDIAAAKAVPLADLYDGQLRRVGRRLSGRCPFHDDRSPSFSIYLEQNSWWCFAENIGGSVIDFVMKMRKYDFLTAVRYLIKK